MHEAAHDEARRRTTSQMQSRTLLHTQVAGQTALGEEVCGELDGTAETSTDHGSSNTTVDTLDTLTFVDLAQSIVRVLVVMLRADREEG